MPSLSLLFRVHTLSIPAAVLAWRGALRTPLWNLAHSLSLSGGGGSSLIEMTAKGMFAMTCRM